MSVRYGFRRMTRGELRLYRRLWMRAARGQAFDTAPPHPGKRWVHGKLQGSAQAGGPRIPGGPAQPRERHAWRVRLQYRHAARCWSCGTKQGLRVIYRVRHDARGREVPMKVLWCGKC